MSWAENFTKRVSAIEKHALDETMIERYEFKQQVQL